MPTRRRIAALLLLAATTSETARSFSTKPFSSRSSLLATPSDDGASESETTGRRSSDMTDRFKWKVNALMGVFDPPGSDDERQDGTILNAMLRFPALYSFHAVGRTRGDGALVDRFVRQVREVVGRTTGDWDGIQCQITPRTRNFTKVTVQANVENAAMIAAAYRGLEELELTVMRF